MSLKINERLLFILRCSIVFIISSLHFVLLGQNVDSVSVDSLNFQVNWIQKPDSLRGNDTIFLQDSVAQTDTNGKRLSVMPSSITRTWNCVPTSSKSASIPRNYMRPVWLTLPEICMVSLYSSKGSPSFAPMKSSITSIPRKVLSLK